MFVSLYCTPIVHEKLRLPETRFSGNPPPFQYYLPEQVKKAQMPILHQTLYRRLVSWAQAKLPTSAGGKRCGLVSALENGTTAFAVCTSTGRYPIDYNNLRTTYGKLLQETFPVLTRENASRLNQQCLVIAVPDYSTNTFPFTVMQNEVRCNHKDESTKRGVVALGVHNDAKLPAALNAPFPLIALRYMVPTDRPFLFQMQDPAAAVKRFDEVYG